jgi:hypothetical protein
MNFVPEKSALEVDEIHKDKEAMGMLAFTTRRRRSERRGCRRRHRRPPPASQASGHPMADMVGLSSSEAREGEKVECAFVLE